MGDVGAGRGAFLKGVEGRGSGSGRWWESVASGEVPRLSGATLPDARVGMCRRGDCEMVTGGLGWESPRIAWAGRQAAKAGDRSRVQTS